MVKTSFKVNQAPISGRIGESVGKGLAEQIPKEVAQYRLSQGLQNFAQNAQNLTPLQQAAQYLSIPGLPPQAAQILPQLLQQQQQRQSLNQLGNQQEPNQKIQQSLSQAAGAQSNQATATGLQTREATEATLENFVPRSFQEKLAAAQQLPLYQSDPQGALNIIDQQDQAAALQNQALQGRRQNQINVANKIKGNLATLDKRYNNIVPGDVFTDIENDTLNSIKPKEQGGQGLTEDQAEKNGADKLKEVSRQYQSLKTLGGVSNYYRNPKTTTNGLHVLQKQFKERDDLRNFADSIVAETNMSAPKAYSIAYPISDYPKVNEVISNLPTLKGNAPDTTADIAPILFKKMGTQASPLAIANALDAKGYNGNAFLKYARDNQDKLSPNQVEQLTKPTGISLGDIFMENTWGAKALFGGVPLFYHYLKE